MQYRCPVPNPDPLVEDLFDEATKPADAVPVSAAFASYLAKRKELLVIRTAAGGWYSREEDPVIADMDDLWSNMTDEELEYIWAQKSWRFSASPTMEAECLTPPSPMNKPST